jgi:hypothetical protein
MSNGIKHSASNNHYIRTLAKEIRSIPGQVLAAATIAGFKAAVRHTYMDSGQFAMNWQLYVGARARFVPATEYRTKNGPMKRGDKLTAKGKADSVFAKVMAREGIPESPYSGYSHSDLYLKISTSRVMKTSIANPFWDDAYGKSNTYNAGGHSSYKSRSAIRPGHMVDKAIRQAATRAAHTALRKLESKA